jgi:5-methylcytosine-specific restriction endonuclease McrA
MTDHAPVSALERMGIPGSLSAPARMTAADGALAPVAPEPVQVPPRPRVAPLSAGRYALQCTIDQPTHDLLRRAQALLGHAVPSGDVGQVLGRALELLVTRLEKRRFGATDRPRPCPRRRDDADPRDIPAEIRRMVWKRDGGRCTFTSDAGRRCESRTALEFDHIEPVARGGESTPGNLRLRCRAHNQHEAERTFGRDFMRHERERAQQARETVRQEREQARTREHSSAPAPTASTERFDSRSRP